MVYVIEMPHEILPGLLCFDLANPTQKKKLKNFTSPRTPPVMLKKKKEETEFNLPVSVCCQSGDPVSCTTYPANTSKKKNDEPRDHLCLSHIATNIFSLFLEPCR